MDKKILLVDDAAFMRMLIRNTLTTNGYTNILEAADGEIAVSTYAAEKPDLVIMDITMPNKTGIEALKEIAFGRVNRGVELTYLSEPTAQLIRKMDLSAVAEFKRNGNGTVEVKFVDRVKALSALYDMLGGGDADEAAEFLQALEQAGEERDDWRP